MIYINKSSLFYTRFLTPSSQGVMRNTMMTIESIDDSLKNYGNGTGGANYAF